MKAAKTIRDPIHGNIHLSQLEVELVDSPWMQKLRHIRQNGFCYLVYPAMNSTRFEHSLGVMHLADKVAEYLGLEDERKQLLRAGGLLHDIGHCAFSHTSDDAMLKMGHSHEENSVRIIKGAEVGKILKKHGINPTEVSDLVMGKGDLGKIISSDIDVDRMDYLTRDSYYAGVAYGIIDLERIIHGLMFLNGELVIKKSSLEAVESLLIGRNMMYQTVYRHHTKRIVEAMFKRALNHLIQNKKIDYDEFIQMDDISIIHKLRNSTSYPKDIMERIDQRRLFKTFFEENIALIEENFRQDIIQNEERIEQQIAQDYGLEKGYVLLDMPETKMSEFRIKIKIRNEFKFINEISPLAKALEKAEEERLTFCLYAPEEEKEKLQDFNPEKYIEFSQTRLRKFL